MYATGFSEVPGHRDVLVCWLGGDGAEAADQMDDDEVNNNNMTTLADAY